MRVSLFILCILMTACSPQLPDRDELADQMYQERLDLLLERFDQDCRERAVNKAERYVDSLVDRWINAGIMDTLNFPQKPVKPDAPPPIIGKVERFEVDTTE